MGVVATYNSIIDSTEQQYSNVWSNLLGEKKRSSDHYKEGGIVKVYFLKML